MTPADGADGANDSPIPFTDRAAELAVLGSLLLYGDAKYARGLAARGLSPTDFYWERNQQVFSAMAALGERRAHINTLTVTAELEQQLGRAIDGDAIDELHGCAPAAGGLKEYADRVMDLARWRRRKSRAYEMLEAIERRDARAWEESIRVFEVPREESSEESPSAVPRLRLTVDGETGEVIDRQETCSECEALKDQLSGAERDIRGWRARYANLQKTMEREAREGALWLVAQALFEVWKRKTGHKRSPFTFQRFQECEPYLRNDAYGPRMIERAIAGIAYDPWKKPRKNGTVYVHNWWEDLFRNHKSFENYANSAPADWKPELRITSEAATEAASDGEKKDESRPRMALVQEQAG